MKRKQDNKNVEVGFDSGSQAKLKKVKSDEMPVERSETTQTSTPAQTSSLPRLSASMFVDPSKWKCEACMTFNDKDAIKCICCETGKPGLEPPPDGVVAHSSMPANGTANKGSIGTNGFIFGSAPQTKQPASAGSIGSGGFVFKPLSSNTSKGVIQSSSQKASSTKSEGLFVFGGGPAKSKESNPSAERKDGVLADSTSEFINAAGSFTEPGLVATFGSGDCAQLGHGEEVTELPRPRPIKSLSDAEVTYATAGGMHNLALSATGKLYSWGCNDDACLGRDGDETTPGEVKGITDKIVDVCAGNNHSAALTAEGSMWLWGTYRGDNGHIGFSKRIKKMHQPMKMILRIPRSRHLAKISSLSCGADHTAVVTTEGKVFSWGAGAQGQLGRKVVAGREVNGLEPRLVILERGRKGAGIKAESVHCGSHHTFVVSATPQNHVYAFGLNNYGQLGLGDREDRHTPCRAISFENLVQARGFKDMSCGVHHTIMLCSDGLLFGCGRTDSGQLGILDTDSKCRLSPVQIGGDRFPTIRQIDCGGNHNLALTEEEYLYSWGYGEMLQLGNGREADETEPFHIKLKGDKKSICVAAGGQHSVILVRKQEK